MYNCSTGRSIYSVAVFAHTGAVHSELSIDLRTQKQHKERSDSLGKVRLCMYENYQEHFVANELIQLCCFCYFFKIKYLVLFVFDIYSPLQATF